MNQTSSLGAKNSRSKKIVICEDDENIIEIVTYLLKEKEYDVIPMINCTDIQDIEKVNPHLLLLDLWMPSLDGSTVTRLLKNKESTKDIPIVIISANNDIEQISEDIGADGFLRKPFDIEELEMTVEKYLRN